MNIEKLQIIQTEEYKAYLKALCRLSSGYVSRIRVQFAERAFDKYQDATIRRIVLAYGEEIEELDEYRYRHFVYVSQHGAVTPESLTDDVLNHAQHYGATIKMLFEIS